MCELGRQVKNKREIKRVKKSALLVSQGIVKLWKELTKMKGKTTLSLVRFLKKNIILDELAYPIICSTGNNITELHYHNYDSPLTSSSMILLDIGFKFENYCCDITRCFPRNGKFTREQKNIYQLVLDCQEFILERIKPGVNFGDLEMMAYLILFQGLERLDLIKKHSLSNFEKQEWLRSNMMYHSLGHPVGLHVHDVNKTEILEENMIYAIEPALYFTESLKQNDLINSDELTKYMSIGGIRIEDTILVTQNGMQILNRINTKKVLPKKIDEIEKILN
jgi:Xaa-Pro aminopeptidase